ncbi:manganese/iron ABC transporter ATP-binding protein [Granulosicoccus antarcticus]|uniref:Fe(3+) dicitrate transport ATP-binding protein FecE n=1 Tax=Granulosicoccus antarcticus IMCC3135 TaxID=1192854 RepID=A0A2Z2NPX5_9GAMM|nr:manganese/iron ABC transporter ATP-binding protein [Granulosicoccus antarcticus]ASJ72515.1 Fe(3+) dicitrate transport ATP-binding protein FecE [Granulosicoccus antarcticus IMCC3135]
MSSALQQTATDADPKAALKIERKALRARQSEEPLGSGIKAEGLSVVYRNGNVALSDATFSIPTGTICALVGINGSGKSTLFKAIMGLVPVARGTVSILGQAAGRALARNIVAYVPQNEEVDWNFPVLVEDVVMMGRYGHMGFLRRASAIDKQKVDQALERVNMNEYRHRQIGELSGGQKKRVFLARALAQEGQVILLDEPFTGVDVTTEDAIIDLLKSLRDEGRVLLVSTHNLGSVPQFCDQVVLVNRKVLDSGPTETVFTQQNLAEAFGGTLRFHVLDSNELHDDDDQRQVTVITDDERPFVLYGDDDIENSQEPAKRV